MKWKSHVVLTLSAGVFAGMVFPAEALGLWGGATLPDAIEGLRRKYIKHRGITHEVALWFLLYIVAFSFWKQICAGCGGYGIFGREFFANPYRIALRILAGYLLGLASGGLLHVAEDVLTNSGVPFLGRRISLSLMATGSVREYVCVVTFSSAALLYGRWLHEKGGLLPLLLGSFDGKRPLLILLLAAILIALAFVKSKLFRKRGVPAYLHR